MFTFGGILCGGRLGLGNLEERLIDEGDVGVVFEVGAYKEAGEVETGCGVTWSATLEDTAWRRE